VGERVKLRGLRLDSAKEATSARAKALQLGFSPSCCGYGGQIGHVSERKMGGRCLSRVIGVSGGYEGEM